MRAYQFLTEAQNYEAMFNSVEKIAAAFSAIESEQSVERENTLVKWVNDNSKEEISWARQNLQISPRSSICALP
jgi:hypothetical protein